MWRVCVTPLPSRHCESPIELIRLSQHRGWKVRETFWIFRWVCLSVRLLVRSRSIRPRASTRAGPRIASKLPSLCEEREKGGCLPFMRNYEPPARLPDGRKSRCHSWLGASEVRVWFWHGGVDATWIKAVEGPFKFCLGYDGRVFEAKWFGKKDPPLTLSHISSAIIAGGFLKTQSLTQTPIMFLLLNGPPKKGSYPT